MLKVYIHAVNEVITNENFKMKLNKTTNCIVVTGLSLILF